MLFISSKIVFQAYFSNWKWIYYKLWKLNTKWYISISSFYWLFVVIIIQHQYIHIWSYIFKIISNELKRNFIYCERKCVRIKLNERRVKLLLFLLLLLYWNALLWTKKYIKFSVVCVKLIIEIMILFCAYKYSRCYSLLLIFIFLKQFTTNVR